MGVVVRHGGIGVPVLVRWRRRSGEAAKREQCGALGGQCRDWTEARYRLTRMRAGAFGSKRKARRPLWPML